MDGIETVSIIGLGAIGSAYSARISETIPVGGIRVIASGKRAERYRSGGVEVNGRRYFFRVCEPGRSESPADLLIFAVKSYDLREAIADAEGHVGPDTVILSLLNGITSERIIAGAYGSGKVLRSFVIGVDATRASCSTVYSTLGSIIFGEERNAPGELSPDVRRVAEFLGRARVNYEIPDDMRFALWKKFMINVGLNQVSAVLRAPYGVMRRVPEALELVRGAMDEVVNIAPSEGVCLTERDRESCFPILDGLSPSGKTSMLQDIEARRPTEVGIFGGAVVELGLKHKKPVPVNTVLTQIIRAIESSYTK
ncbi:MAG: ketopantoate reductase family protein [Synergistaceae bacterium]|jgi:2-dehydropantoate 2-reductase|nr:ketopantoate reductase family protein [Synergistaceae bacterium]